MNGDKRLIWLYGILLVLLGMFFASLFFFVTSARQLHSEGVLRRPPKHGARTDRPEAKRPDTAATTDLQATSTILP